MISERDLRLAKAIVDPYIGRDIIAMVIVQTPIVFQLIRMTKLMRYREEQFRRHTYVISDQYAIRCQSGNLRISP